MIDRVPKVINRHRSKTVDLLSTSLGRWGI